MPSISKYPSGLKVIINEQPATAAATILVMCRVGSRYEKKSLGGIAHFVEHLMFKGTKKRPDTLSLSQELDSIGADYNAFTAKEYTGYYIKVQSGQIAKAIDVLADMLNNSKFDAAELEREKGVIIEEINMYEDTPMLMQEDVFDSLAYRGNSLARDVAGSKQTVSNLTRDDILKFVRTYYQPANMFISVSGQVETNKLNRWLEKKFKANQKSISHFPAYSRFSKRQSQPRLLVKKKKTEQIHLALGFINNINHRSINLLPIQLGSSAFGGNMSSRLFINIRERQGLCYYIRSKANVYEDSGNFTVYAGLDRSRLPEAVKLIMEEFSKLKKRGISGQELSKAKEYLKGKIILSLEDSANLSQWYAEKMLFGKKLESPEEFIKRVDGTKLKDVNRVIKTVLKESNLNLALTGNVSDTRYLKKLLVI